MSESIDRLTAKTVHFVSLGCPKNLVDTEMMLGSLSANNYRVVEDAEDAETVIVNTCGFIEEAKQESIDKILELAELKQKGLKNLVVAGCLTQRYKADLIEGLPEADLFVGSGEFQNISSLLENRNQGDLKKDFYHLPTFLQTASTPRLNSQPRHRAYLKISEGCKKRCAFCAIPLIRGNLQSREIQAVVAEAKLLVAGGVKELIVVSHDFTDYGWDLRKKNSDSQATSIELLRALAEESGAHWVRVLYLYPDGIQSQLLDLMNQHPNLVKYFDIPLQHINNQMLSRMNRRMTREFVEDVLTRIRQEISEPVIRTQFIVGFPGETEEMFEELLEFVEKWKLDRVGCFKYSLEEDTKAGQMPDQISDEVKQDRYERLMELQQRLSRESQQKWIGRIIPVLVEGFSDETELLLQGRHFGQAPDIDGLTYISEGEANVGDIVMVEITDSHDYDLVGRIVDHEGQPNATLTQTSFVL